MRPTSPGPGAMPLLDPRPSNVSCTAPCASSSRSIPRGQRVIPPNASASSSASDSGAPRPSDEVADEAAEWVIRRHGEGWSAQDDEELGRWRSLAASHELAYERAERLWSALGDLKQAPELVDTLSAAGVPATVSAPSMVAPRGAPSALGIPSGTKARRRPNPWRHVAGAGAMLGMAAIAILAATGGEPMLALQADVRTAVGETRDIGLTDGSRVRLGSDSAIAFRFTDTERRIELLQGDAVFEARSVDADASKPQPERRPFVVAAASGTTRALGTRFIVERLATHTRVVGVEHQVAVALAAAPQSATTLSPGQVLRYDASRVGPVESLSPQLAEAEAKGQLVFERTPLVDVVQRLNRHFVGHLSVRGDAARREVSGVFPASDVEGAITALRAELGLKALRLPGVIVLY